MNHHNQAIDPLMRKISFDLSTVKKSLKVDSSHKLSSAYRKRKTLDKAAGGD
jgi:hypothetical protein